MSLDVMFFTNQTLASSKTRGEQIAARLNAPVNRQFDVNDAPKNVVFVKCFPGEIDAIPRTTQIWYDPIDSDFGLERIANRPFINVIAISESSERYLKARLPNKIVLIKEHHCNFDRLIRPERPVKIVGFIGYKDCFDLNLDEVATELEKVGLELWVHFVDLNTTRETVCDFYSAIDIQITFRGPRLLASMPPEMKNPLKVINAASFGIPTVGYPEISYEEFPVSMPVYTLDELICACERVKNTPGFYQPGGFTAEGLRNKAETYHVENIVARYKEVIQ